jgi:hypothetical protein
MKKILSMLVIAVSLTACGSGNNESSTTNVREDSVKKASDSVHQTGDTSALNRVTGDTTSKSGTNRAGSGSKVSGGKSAAPQKKSGK